MENQIDPQENQNESKPEVRGKSSIKMRIWNIACIILFAAGIVFFIFFFDQYHHIPILHYDWAIIASAAAAMAIILICFFGSLKKIGAVKFSALIIAGIMLAANWCIYFRYIPKYGPMDGCAIVKKDPKYVSAIVEPHYYTQPKQLGSYKIEDNPFYEWGYLLNVIDDGKVTEWIAFDSATGKYYTFYEPKE